jgi:hypothetical protein
LPRCNDRFLLSIDCHRLSNVWEGTRTVYLLVFQQPARCVRSLRTRAVRRRESPLNRSGWIASTSYPWPGFNVVYL